MKQSRNTFLDSIENNFLISRSINSKIEHLYIFVNISLKKFNFIYVFIQYYLHGLIYLLLLYII